jgi:hypothetical protein
MDQALSAAPAFPQACNTLITLATLWLATLFQPYLSFDSPLSESSYTCTQDVAQTQSGRRSAIAWDGAQLTVSNEQQ